MNLLEMNEKLRKHQVGVLKTLPISQILSAQEYPTRF